MGFIWIFVLFIFISEFGFYINNSPFQGYVCTGYFINSFLFVIGTSSNFCHVPRAITMPRKSGKGKFCSAYGCSKSSSATNTAVSFHLFPDPSSDSDRHDQWVREVKRTREDWKYTKSYSVLCSEHFTENDFEPVNIIQKQLGYKTKPTLKANAVPSKFFKRTHDKPPPTKRSRTSIEKREASRRQVAVSSQK